MSQGLASRLLSRDRTVPEWMKTLAVRPDTSHADDDEFDDGTLGGTVIATTGSATWTESRGVLSCVFDSQSASDYVCRVFALSPSSSPVTIETQMRFNTRYTTNPMCGILFTDGTASSSGLAGFGLAVNASSQFLTKATGTVTNVTAPASITGLSYISDVFLRLIWSATNTFEVAVSPDGVSWTDYGDTGFTPTLTPTHFGVWVSSWTQTFPSVATWEYLRVYESDLSV